MNLSQIKLLEDLIEKQLAKGLQPSAKLILCLASYKSLNEYNWCRQLTITNEIKEVFSCQFSEPQQEKRLKLNIPILKEITDKVSSKVREQYESNPYPRWVNSKLPLNPSSISKVVNEIKLKLYHPEIRKIEKPNILIAGCGTGQHSIGTAARFKNSRVLAVDLSLF